MTNEQIHQITVESLRDWFKKEKWVRISSSGNIAGPCGTSKNKKNPDRCLPKAKAQSLTKNQRAATARKKKKAGAKGKTVVKNTKAATVKKENQHRKWTREDMDTYIDEVLGGYLERYLGYNPGPPNHPMYKMTPEQFSAYIAQEMIGGIDELLDEVDTNITFIRDALEDHYEERKKIAMGVGHDPDMHFEPEEEKIGADALGMVLTALDKMATPTKLEERRKMKNTKKTIIKKNILTALHLLKEETGKDYTSHLEKIIDRLKDIDISIDYLASAIVGKDSAEVDIAQDFFGRLANPKAPGANKVKKETKGAPKGHYFTKSGNLVKGKLTKDARERGARLSDPKDKQRSKVPPVTQYNETSDPNDGKAAPFGSGYKPITEMTLEDLKNLTVGLLHEIQQKEDVLQEDDRCTRIAKQKYDTWPSAYASGAVVRCRRGEIWKKKK